MIAFNEPEWSYDTFRRKIENNEDLTNYYFSLIWDTYIMRRMMMEKCPPLTEELNKRKKKRHKEVYLRIVHNYNPSDYLGKVELSLSDIDMAERNGVLMHSVMHRILYYDLPIKKAVRHREATSEGIIYKNVEKAPGLEVTEVNRFDYDTVLYAMDNMMPPLSYFHMVNRRQKSLQECADGPVNIFLEDPITLKMMNKAMKINLNYRRWMTRIVQEKYSPKAAIFRQRYDPDETPEEHALRKTPRDTTKEYYDRKAQEKELVEKLGLTWDDPLNYRGELRKDGKLRREAGIKAYLYASRRKSGWTPEEARFIEPERTEPYHPDDPLYIEPEYLPVIIENGYSIVRARAMINDGVPIDRLLRKQPGTVKLMEQGRTVHIMDIFTRKYTRMEWYCGRYIYSEMTHPYHSKALDGIRRTIENGHVERLSFADIMAFRYLNPYHYRQFDSMFEYVKIFDSMTEAERYLSEQKQPFRV